MRIKRLTLSIVMLAVISSDWSFGRSLGQSGRERIEIEKEWRGEIKQELRRQAPPDLFIANEKAWAKLWKAYRGNEELPKIDFEKQLILVGVSDAINHDPMPGLTPVEEGDLKVMFLSHLTPPGNTETCRYTFVLINREGVKSINGKPIRKG
jgi:hypothetical protein